MEQKARITILLAVFAAAFSLKLYAQDEAGQEDSLVRLQKAKSLELIEKYNRHYRKTVDATFLHAGTYLVCDTALWDVDRKVINAWGNVRLIQGETELTSDKLDYFVDDNLAQFRGQLVQLRNKENNTLRTRFLDYNTRDSVATFHSGASMKDAEGQVIESMNGTYESGCKLFTFQKKVNMYTDSTFVKTRELLYHSDRALAEFTVPIEFWNEDNMLSAARGWYDRDKELFFFRDNVHALSKEQEAWGDTMYFYRAPRNLEMRSRVQIQDTVHNSYAVADYVFYEDSTSTLRMEKKAAVALVTQEKNKRPDTLYFGADTLMLRTFLMCDIEDDVLKAAKDRKEDIMTDPVSMFRRKAAEEAAKAAAEKIKNDPNRPHPADDKPDGAPPKSPDESSDAPPQPLPEDAAAPQAEPDSLPKVDSISNVIQTDSLKINFVTGVGRVRAFRKDIQVRCDSLRYCDLDSIARFYIDPVVWNDGNRQYTSDSLFLLVNNKGVDRASLMSNAFIITQEDSVYFDQIKSADVMAYFDTTSALRRFDALGGVMAMFMLQENDAYATVNKVETKMMSALLENGQLNRVFYFDSPKNNASPVAQMSKAELKMKDFRWRSEERPKCPADITSLKIRPSQRSYYEARPKASFEQTDIYFPGYIAGVYRGLEQARIRKKQRKVEGGPQSDTTEVRLANDTTTVLADSVALSDTLSLAAADSLAAAAVSPAIADTSLVTAPTDSLMQATVDTVGVASAADSLAQAAAIGAAEVAAVDLAAQEAARKAEQRAAERQARRDQAEKERQARIDKRDAKWAALDSVDLAKVKAKEQKKLEKKREKTRKAYTKILIQEYKDNYKLNKFVLRYRKKKVKEYRITPKQPAKVLLPGMSGAAFPENDGEMKKQEDTSVVENNAETKE